jgi:hypothetical protein
MPGGGGSNAKSGKGGGKKAGIVTRVVKAVKKAAKSMKAKITPYRLVGKKKAG